MSFPIHEFRHTILFLVKFIAIYLIGNLLYGFYVTSYKPKPDPATRIVSQHTAVVLDICGSPAIAADDVRKATTNIIFNDRAILAVYEGCNGLNTMIIFVAFVFAFGPVSRTMLWFVPLGLAIIHLANLARITMLFYVTVHMPRYLYFTHKYLFTAILYLVIFLLWIWWVKRFSLIKK
jgi:exosortase family protein XrtF